MKTTPFQISTRFKGVDISLPLARSGMAVGATKIGHAIPQLMI